MSSKGARKPYNRCAISCKSFILLPSVVQELFSLLSMSFDSSRRSSFFVSTFTSLSMIPLTSILLFEIPGRRISPIMVSGNGDLFLRGVVPVSCYLSSSTRSPIISCIFAARCSSCSGGISLITLSVLVSITLTTIRLVASST